MANATLPLDDFSGGLNLFDPPTALPDNQVVEAFNVHWDTSRIGVKRAGLTSKLTGTSGYGAIFMHRHLPTNDPTQAELYVLHYHSGTNDRLFAVATTGAINSFAASDNIDLAAVYRLFGVSAQGKVLVCYKSAVDRMHVVAGARDASTTASSVRRAGVAQPAAPTVANQGLGSFAGARQYRVRYTFQATGVTYRRSEPSAATAFNPSGTGAAARVTKPASISEGETHWEVEEIDLNGNWYRIATVAVGMGTYDDSLALTAIASSGILSEEIGDYTPLYSAQFAIVDEDRVLIGGAHNDATKASRVSWTPTSGEPGVGNNERIPINPASFVDLDAGNGGGLTGLVGPINGIIYAFKFRQIYKLLRTNNRQQAYIAVPISKDKGALEGSIVEGVDESGAPCVYFWDPQLGPHRVGQYGVQYCGLDVKPLARTVNTNGLVFDAFYNPALSQVQWRMPTNAATLPDLEFVFNCKYGRSGQDGVRGGWSIYNGPHASAVASCLFSQVNPFSGGLASDNALVPYLGMRTNSPQVVVADSGNDDAGTAYQAYVTSKPIIAGRSVLQKTGVMSAAVVAKPAAGVSVQLTLIRDFGIESKSFAAALTATAAETAGGATRVIRSLDDAKLSELKALQVRIGDAAAVAALWTVDRIDLRLRGEEKQ